MQRCVLCWYNTSLKFVKCPISDQASSLLLDSGFGFHPLLFYKSTAHITLSDQSNCFLLFKADQLQLQLQKLLCVYIVYILLVYFLITSDQLIINKIMTSLLSIRALLKTISLIIVQTLQILSCFVTCRLAVVLQHFTQDQLVGVFTKRVTEHGSRDQIHVAVRAFRLVGTGAIEVPLRQIYTSRRAVILNYMIAHQDIFRSQTFSGDSGVLPSMLLGSQSRVLVLHRSPSPVPSIQIYIAWTFSP